MAVCSSCGKQMECDGVNKRVAAVELTMQTDDNPAIRQFLQRQMGPYRLGHKYEICVECYLNHFEVKL